ncbi:MAG: copper chaperone PCu(A)C [Magnetococcus sp. YQC-5]
MKRLSLLGLIFAVLLMLPCSVQAVDAIQIKDPWIRAAPPVVQTLAAYMTIQNQSQQEKIIVSISSPLFASVELHETIQHDGMTMMKAHKQLPIPAGASVQLTPGGYHLMLIAPQKALRPADRVPMTLTFLDGARLTFEAEVRSGTNQPAEKTGHEPMHH